MTWILLLTACIERTPLEPVPPGFPVAVDEGAVMWGFSWVDGHHLAAMPRPQADDLHAIGAEGVELLVTLTETALDPADLESAGLESLHLPIEDYQAPTMDQMIAFTDEVAARRDAGSPVGVHCLAGRGRSGTMAAVWFVHEGATADEAIARIRELRPGSIETAEQEQAVADYEVFLAL